MSKALLLVTVLALAAAAAATATTQARPRVIVFGDSVAAALEHSKDARALLGRGVGLRIDARVCRRLVEPSCSYQGEQPPTALEAIAAAGPELRGAAVVVAVGYNDWPERYAPGIERVLRALDRLDAGTVIWVTLKEDRDTYAAMNDDIRAAADRRPGTIVADWNAYSRAKPWFNTDGLHLNEVGALELARLLRGHLARALCLPRCPRPPD